VWRRLGAELWYSKRWTVSWSGGRAGLPRSTENLNKQGKMRSVLASVTGTDNQSAKQALVSFTDADGEQQLTSTS